MKKNVKIAKQLLKIARQLVAEKTMNAGDITDGINGYLQQLAVLRQFPTDTNGDVAIHSYVGNAFKALYTIKNGTFQAWEDWAKYCQQGIREIVNAANASIASNGNLRGISRQDKDVLTKVLGFQANPKFLVSITPGPFKKNILQSHPGDKGEEYEIPLVPRPGVDKNTHTVALNAPPEKANTDVLLSIPRDMLGIHDSILTIVTSWGNRILGGTQLGTFDLLKKTDSEPAKFKKEKGQLVSSWTEISDSTLNELEMRIFAKLTKQPSDAVLGKFQAIMINLANQLGTSISAQAEEEFKKNHRNVVIAIEGMNKKIVGYFATYRDGVKDLLNEYNRMVDKVTEQGGIVDCKGNIIVQKNDENNGEATASVNRTAGFLDSLKSIGQKIVNGVSSFCKKLFGIKAEARQEMKTVANAVIDWSNAGQDVTQERQQSCQAIVDCINALDAFASEQ